MDFGGIGAFNWTILKHLPSLASLNLSKLLPQNIIKIHGLIFKFFGI